MRIKRMGLWRSLSLALMALASASATRAQDAPVALTLAAQGFREAQVICQQDGGKLWGVSLCGPMLFVDAKSREVFANQADKEGLLTKSGEVFVGKLPDQINVANTATEWAGVKWTMIIFPLPEDKYRRAGLMAHELWHRVQEELGFHSSGAQNNHLDSRAGRVWLQLEWRALAAALKMRGVERRRAVKDALLFRAYRRSLFSQAVAEENAMEMHEGLAEYTGVKLSGHPAPALYVAATELKEAAARQTFVRSFAYATGPAYGILLDETGARWRERLKREDDLGRLLQERLGIPPPQNMKREAARRAALYGADELEAAEAARENQRLKLLAGYRARLVNGPVLILPLEKMSMQFNPGTLLPLDALGTVYPELRVVDAWGILTATKGALINQTFTRIYLSAPTEVSAALIKGDGWTLQLQGGWAIAPAERGGDYLLKKREASSQRPQDSPALSREDEALIAEAYHLWQSLGEKLWQGWTEIQMPLLFIKGDEEYAIAFPRTLQGFTSLGKSSALSRSVQVRKRTLAPDLSASFSIEGVAAVVIGTPEALEKSPAEWVLTTAHEMFHVLQAARGEDEKVAALKLGSGSDASWQLDYPFPYKDDDLMRLIHLQGYPIYLAATEADQAAVKYDAGTALEAVRVYENLLRSRAEGDDRFYRYSQFQEWAEGIAFYTEYRMAEAAALSDYRTTDAFQRLKNFKSYQQVWEETYKNRIFLTKHAGRAARSRLAFYHLGLGKGLLLDRLMPDWKARYFAPGIWPDQLIMDALGQPRELRAVTIGAKAPDFTLASTTGESVSLGGYGGRVVLVNFWQTWCPPCVEDVPRLKALQDKYGKQGFSILGVTSQLDEEGVERVRAFVKDNRLNYQALLDLKGSVAALYGVSGYPHVFLVDQDGRVVYDKVGYQRGDEEELERAIQKALRKSEQPLKIIK